jgi:hypothetical protein
MTDAKTHDRTLDDLTIPVGESKDPAYLAWRDAQARAALARAAAHPDDMIPERMIWEKFGLEY